jgi:transposase
VRFSPFANGPLQLRVRVTRRPRYACRTCEGAIVVASAPHGLAHRRARAHRLRTHQSSPAAHTAAVELAPKRPRPGVDRRMIDQIEKTVRLLEKLQAALPMPARATPEFVATLRA